MMAAHHQASRHWMENITASAPTMVDKRDEQVLRPVVGQLRQLKQVRGQAAHQLAGAVFIVKVKAQVLHMANRSRRISASTRMPKVWPQ